MKILHVVPSLLKNGGGPSESVPMTAIAQARAGLEVAIAFYDAGEISPRALEAEESGVKLLRFKGGASRINPAAFSFDFVRRFGKVAAEYDVIHTHIQWMFPIWWAAHTARRLGKRLVMMPRGSFAPARLRESGWKKRLVGWIDRHYANAADSVWATAESEAGEIKAFARDARTEVFPIGLDVSRYIASRQNGRTLLYMSRISPIKGLDMLAEAWGRRGGESGWKLVIAGPDDRGYTGEIKKVFARKCKEGSYEFRGPVYGEEKTHLLSQADAFILPTRNENWGIAVAEAMASALPVICTKGAPWQCLESARAGWWTDATADGIEEALGGLFAMSREERLATGANGRRWVEENLDWGAIGSKMRTSYERALPLLMTASVDTRGMAGADFDAAERERMYLDTLRFYIDGAPGRGQRKIVFAENSGWNLEAMAAKLGAFDKSRVEFIALPPGDFDVSRGKGWNDFRLITEAIERSRFIKEAGAFLKVTGRYPIYNIERFMKEAERAILRNGCAFYGDIKDHGLYELMHLPWTGRIGSSILFATTVERWRGEIAPRCDRLDDAKGYWAEHLVYDYLKECSKTGTPAVCRFGRELRCGGKKGSTGSGAWFAKENVSFKERVNRAIGNFVRIFMPWFRF